MKRKSIFMWAYITAICLCAILRAYTDYDQWDSIVFAITVSSAFFAVEDLLSSVCRALHDSCNLLDDYIEKAKENAERDRSFFNRLEEKANHQSFTRETHSHLFESNDSLLAVINEAIASAEEVNLKIENSRIKLKRYDRFSTFLAYIGFLCLFCMVFFSSFISLSSVLLEILTVLSFAVIMSTQQLNLYFAQKIVEESKTCHKALKLDELTTERYPEIEHHFDEMIEAQKRVDENEQKIARLSQEIERLEAQCHAD